MNVPFTLAMVKNSHPKCNEETEEEEKHHKDEVQQFHYICKDAFCDNVKKVVISNRIADSPWVLVPSLTICAHVFGLPSSCS
jgi:HSP90 family molecular chaperone